MRGENDAKLYQLNVKTCCHMLSMSVGMMVEMTAFGKLSETTGRKAKGTKAQDALSQPGR